MALAKPAFDASADTQGRPAVGAFLLSVFGRFVGGVALTWLLLAILLPDPVGAPAVPPIPLDRLAVTLPLVLMAGIIALLLGTGISLGAARVGGWLDRLLGGASTLLSYLPPFWLGLLLSLVLGGMLGWLPGSGFVPWSAGPVQALASLVLPALALGLPHAGEFATRLRAAFGPEANEREIRRMRIGGATAEQARWRVGVAGVLRQAPRLAGRVLASILVGAVVVENVFYLPGLGRQVLGAALAHDLPALRTGLFLLVTLAAVLMLLGALGRLAVDRLARAAE